MLSSASGFQTGKGESTVAIQCIQANITKAQAMIRNEHRASIALNAAACAELSQLLNQQLADTVDLFSQIKQEHWHAKGMHFYQFHRLFDRLAEDLEKHTDTIAERITTLGGAAKGTLRMCAAGSRLPELPLDVGDGQCTVMLLVERYAQLARTTWKAIAEAGKLGDADTADLFTSVSHDLDDAIWFLEAHLRDLPLTTGRGVEVMLGNDTDTALRSWPSTFV